MYPGNLFVCIVSVMQERRKLALKKNQRHGTEAFHKRPDQRFRSLRDGNPVRLDRCP